MFAEKLQEQLERLEIPVYNTIIPDEEATAPYLIYVEGEPRTFEADGIVFYSEPTYIVELYTIIKDYELEKKIEDIFDELELYYEKSADMYDEDEQLTAVSYSI